MPLVNMSYLSFVLLRKEDGFLVSSDFYFVYHWAEKKSILMHLQMQRDVWLDNGINLRQYILR